MNRSLQLVIIITLVLPGCTFENQSIKADSKVPKEMGKNDKATIKVLYYNENSFFQQYGNMFAAKFPNIEVNVVSTQAIEQPGILNYQEQFDKLIEKEKPDVLLLRMDQYEQMAAGGMLLELNSLIKQDKFDIENISPAIIDLIKSKSDGKLDGLTPTLMDGSVFFKAVSIY